MSDPVDAVRRAGVPNPAPAVVPAEPEASAPVVAANRAARERFFETLGTMEGLSPRFLNYVRGRLGLEGRTEIASQPLEEREVNEIVTEAKRQAAVGTLQVSEVVCEAVAQYVDSSFALTLTVVKSVAQLLTMAVRLRSIILRYRLECAMADAKAKAALADLKIRELVSEITEAFRELDAEIKRLQESIRKDSAQVIGLKADATAHLESEKREWTKAVAGFEARMERLREDVRNEIDELAKTRLDIRNVDRKAHR